MLYSWRSQFRENILYFLLRNFRLCYPEMRCGRNILLFNFCSISCQVVEVKNKRKFQIVSSKSGRGRLREMVGYSDLTWKLLPFLEN